ncbi:MAG: hypothetical protein IKR85_03600 [Clostridia bacterium]|nr:hypothetical protein [Clostridia bacterium]
MPNTKITKARLINHWAYSKNLYIFGTIAVIALAALLFTMTRHTPDNAHSVEIALVDNFADVTLLDEYKQKLLDSLLKLNPDAEQVSFMNIAYNAENPNSDSYYGAQTYTVQLQAGSNDIYMMPVSMAEELIQAGYCVPLERLDYYETFRARHPEALFIAYDEPSENAQQDETDEEAETAPAVQHYYAVDVSPLSSLIDKNIFNVNGKYAVIVVSSKNPNDALYTLCDMFDMFTPEKE